VTRHIASPFGRLPLVSLLIALAGVVAFRALGLPLPYLLGPMFACLIAALLGAELRGTGAFGTAMRTILGLAVGSAISPELIGRLPGMLLSVSLVIPLVVLCGVFGVLYFRRICGFDPVTAYYSAMPGGLQDMVIFGEEAGANVRSLSLVHATRVLVIVTLVPILLGLVYGIALDRPPGRPVADLPAAELAIMAVVCLAGWRLAAAIGLFGASIIGPIVLGAIATLSGLIEHRPPSEALAAAQLFIGHAVGVRYSGITLHELRRDVFAGLGYCFVLAAIAIAIAELDMILGLAPPLDALLSFAPGGQAEMALLAILAGADLAFVVTHHLVRMVVVIIGAPIAARLGAARGPGGLS